MALTLWPNNNAHMLFSYALLVGKALWFPHAFSTWWIVGFLFLWGVVKEFAWDVHVEKSQGYVGAAWDAAFYGIGLTVTSIVLYLSNKF